MKVRDKKYWMFELKTGLFALSLSVLYFILTFTIKAKGKLKKVDFNNISPSLMPRIIAVVAIIVSIAMIIEAFSNYRKADVGMGGEPESMLSFMDKDRITVVLMVVAYLILLKVIGYILSTFLLSMAVLNYLDRSKWKRNTVYSIIFPAVCFLIFNNLLQIWLPMGVFFE